MVPHFMSKKVTALCVFLGLFLSPLSIRAAEEQFQDTEIRVIKNKSFQKRLRFELGLDMGAVVNQSFFYTYLAAAHLGFHITESWAIAAEGGVGITRNKADCDNLGKTFKIEPISAPLDHYAGASLAYTPIYGKYQMSSGDVLYFDTFISAGGGIAGIMHQDFSCAAVPEGKENTKSIYSTTQVNFAVGQRLSMTKNLALLWQVKLLYAPTSAEHTLFEESPNVALSLGVGYFL